MTYSKNRSARGRLNEGIGVSGITSRLCFWQIGSNIGSALGSCVKYCTDINRHGRSSVLPPATTKNEKHVITICYKSFLINRGGYTLFEVLAALIIIGIAVTAVIGGLSSAKRLSAKSDHVLEANRILNNLICNSLFLKAVNEAETLEKKLEDEPGWKCRATSEPLVLNSAEVLTLEVEGEEGRIKQLKPGAKTKKKGRASGEEIEVSGMRKIEICISDENNVIEREYCIFSWVRE